MEITKDNIDSLNAELKIRLTENDYQSKVNTVLKDYQKKVTVKGFRQGMVPMGMVKKMYGKSVLVDEVNKLLSKSLYEYLHKNKIEVLGTPLPKETGNGDIDWEHQREFEFTYEMGLSPAIQLKLQNEKVIKYKVTKDDVLTNKYTDYLRQRMGSHKDVQVSETDDLVYGDFSEMSDDHAILAGGVFKKDCPVAPATIKNEKVSSKFIGLKPGDKIIVDPKLVENNPTALATMLGIDKDKAGTLGNTFHFSVTKITRMVPAEMNQEFFNMVYGKDTVKSEDEFQNKNSEAALAMVNAESEKKYQYDLIDRAIDKTKAPLPDDFLKRWLVKSNDKPITLEEVEKDYSNYSKGIKWQLIKGAIIKENSISVSDDEISNEAKNFIRSQYAQYGQTDVPEKELDDIAIKILGNQEEKNKIMENLYEAKVVDHLKSTMIAKDKEVKYEEFIKIANQETGKEKSGLAGISKFIKSGFRKS